MQLKTLSLISFTFLASFLLAPQAQANCLVLEKVFSSPQNKTIVAVVPFQLKSSDPSDTWLSQGLRFFVGDLFKSVAQVNVVSSPDSSKYLVQGTVQHLESSMRVFVSLYLGNELVKRYELNTPLPLQPTFFLQLSEMTRGMFKDLHFEAHERTFLDLRNAASSVQAYQFYTRGRELLLQQDASKFPEAARWFTEAKRVDFRSPLGYAGGFETELLQALELKQQQKPFRAAFEKAENELKLIDQHRIPVPDAIFLLPNNSLQKDEDGQRHNRFISAQAIFIEALAHYQRGNFRKARTALENVLAAVPEDGIAWHYLGKAEADLHHESRAETYFAKSREWNRCLP